MTQTEVLAALKKHGELTVPEIAEHTNANPHTVAQSVVKLKRKHEIEETPIKDRKRQGPLYKYRLKGG